MKLKKQLLLGILPIILALLAGVTVAFGGSSVARADTVYLVNRGGSVITLERGQMRFAFASEGAKPEKGPPEVEYGDDEQHCIDVVIIDRNKAGFEDWDWYERLKVQNFSTTGALYRASFYYYFETHPDGSDVTRDDALAAAEANLTAKIAELPIGDYAIGAYAYYQTLGGGDENEKYRVYDMYDFSIRGSEALPAEPTKDGHTFTGWFYDEECEQPYDGGQIFSDTILYAGWSINSYTVKYNTNGGAGIDAESVVYNTVAPTPTPTKIDYTFLGWFLDAALTQPYTDTPVVADITLYASWRSDFIAVSFDTVGGEVITAISVAYGSALDNMPTPVRAGFAFLGWYLDAGYALQLDAEAEHFNDVTLYALWRRDVFVVTFIVDGSVYATIEVNYGATLADALVASSLASDVSFYLDKYMTSSVNLDESVINDITIYGVKGDVGAFGMLGRRIDIFFGDVVAFFLAWWWCFALAAVAIVGGIGYVKSRQ